MSGFIGNLSPEQEAALVQIKAALGRNLNGDMLKCAQKFLDDPIILRFLRARKFDLNASYEMLINMLKFRVEFQQIGVDALNPYMCDNELKVGKGYYHKHDKEGRPVCYVRARLHDPAMTDVLENQRYTVLMMEYGKTLLRPPGETVTIVFDMTNVAIKNLDTKAMKFMVDTLQSFYPESLGKVLVYNSTWIVYGVWKIIKPWLDPVTAAKVFFVKDNELLNYIPVESVPAEYGGTDPYVYNYTHYRTLFKSFGEPAADPSEPAAEPAA